MDRDLVRVRRMLEEDFKVPPRILELNRHHPLIQNLAHLITTRPADPVIDPTIEQLFENMLLLEGLHPNPADMVPRIQALLEAATRERGGSGGEWVTFDAWGGVKLNRKGETSPMPRPLLFRAVGAA